jgi:tRNA A37 threonylcarbamoyltransferase TsaD
MEVFHPPLEYTTDNAAMIAALGYYLLKEGKIADLTLEAKP